LIELILWKCLYYQKILQIQCSPHENFNVIFHRSRKINPKVHEGTKDTKKPKQSRAKKKKKKMLDVSQYLTSNYTAET
jgi:hypothetical protein